MGFSILQQLLERRIPCPLVVSNDEQGGGQYGLVSGGGNYVELGPFATSLGGDTHTAQGNITTMVGGRGSQALGPVSTVLGALVKTNDTKEGCYECK